MVNLFNHEWTCLSVGLASTYIALILLGFILIIVSFFANRKARPVSSYTMASNSSIQGVISKPADTGIHFSLALLTKQGHFGRYWVLHGRLVARRPYIVILISLIITGAIGSGLMKLTMEDSADKLWTVQRGDSVSNKTNFEENFGLKASSSFIVTATNDHPVLSKEVLLQVLRIQQQVENIQVTVDDRTWTWKDICLRQNGKF
jgi:hypothetical protein